MRAWTRGRSQLWLVLAHAGMLQMVTGVARPTISYRALEQGVQPTVLGLVAACYTAVPAILAITFGRYVDRLGQRFVLLAGSSAMLVSMLVLLGLPGSLAATFVGTVALGLGQLFGMFAEQSLVAGLAGRRGIDVAFGRFTFAGSFGQILGPVAVTAIAGDASSPNTTALLLASSAGVCVMLACGLPVRSLAVAGVSEDAPRGDQVRRILGVPSVRAAMLASLANLAALDILMVYLPLLGTTRSLSGQTIGMLLAVRAVMSMVSRFFVARLTQRFTRPGILTVSMCGSALAVALVASGAPVPVLVVLLAVAGLGLGLGQPLTLAWVVARAPEQLRNTALSWRLAGNRITQTVVPIAAGAVATGAGAGAVFLVTAALLGGAALVASRFRTVAGQPTPPAARVPVPAEGDAGGRGGPNG